MNKSRLQVIIIRDVKVTTFGVTRIDDEMEMSLHGDLIYRGPVLLNIPAIRRLRTWSGLGLYEALAIWDNREVLE
jgi:hypothetical protein